MQLRDYIRYKNAKNFYNGSVEAEFLNTVHIPNPTQILRHQKEMFQTFAEKYSFNDPAIKQLNNDLMGKYQNQTNYDFNKVITKIENYVRSLNSNDPKKIEERMALIAQLEGQVESVDQLIREYIIFFNNLGTMRSMSEVQYALKPIYERLKILESMAQSITQGNIGFPPTGTLCGRISWCEYAIKGQYLELEGKKFITENLPTNLKVIQTGQIKGYYDIFGQFKNSGSMKEDLMILDSDNFQISFTMGKDTEVKQMSLKNFLKFMENKKNQKTIRLTQAGYDTLVSHLVTGIQAKATSSNKIRFGKVNINNGQGGIAEKALMTLKEIYKNQEKKTLLVKHDDYQALFNYNLAHYLGYIIGKNNKLLLTRNGLVDMYSFIIEQFDANRYFYGLDDFNLNSNAGISVGINFSE